MCRHTEAEVDVPGEESRPGWRQWTEGEEAAKVKSDGPQGWAEELRLRPEGQSDGAASALLTAKTIQLPLSSSAALPLRLSGAAPSLWLGHRPLSPGRDYHPCV